MHNADDKYELITTSADSLFFSFHFFFTCCAKAVYFKVVHVKYCFCTLHLLWSFLNLNVDRKQNTHNELKPSGEKKEELTTVREVTINQSMLLLLKECAFQKFGSFVQVK